MVPVSISFLTALFTPVNILNYSIPATIVAIAEWIIPMIHKLNGQYELVHVVKFYFSVMWLVSPIFFIAMFKDGWLNDALVQAYKRQNFWRPLGIVIFFILSVVVCAIAGIDPKETDDVRTYATLHSRLGLSIYGFVVANGPAFTFALLVHLIKNFNEIYS
jgi:hypothetical protein